MILKILRKELREFRRQPRAMCLLLAIGVALAASCIAHHFIWLEQYREQKSSQIQSREDWVSQENTSPHQATHDGYTVFKLPAPLASIDPGVSAELGTKVRLESHQRHQATGVPRDDEISLLQLDFTSPALLMQVILPLVVIALSHSGVSQERDRRTWELSLSLGASPTALIWGKVAAIMLLMLAVSSPVLISICWTTLQISTDVDFPLLEMFVRSVAVFLVSMLYLAGWCMVGIALSTRFSSGATLITLLACWALWTLVIPRLAVDLAHSQFPLPDKQSQLEAREAAVREGSHGDTSLQDLNAELEERLMKEHGVTDLNDLPIDLNAARLLAMEEFTNAIDDDADEQRAMIHQEQIQFLGWFELLTPYLAIRSTSTAFAGTDQHHHEVFIGSAEEHRRMLVKTMNIAEMNDESPGPDRESARTFWGKVPEFQQSSPSLASLARSLRLSGSALLGWLVVILIFTVMSSRLQFA